MGGPSRNGQVLIAERVVLTGPYLGLFIFVKWLSLDGRFFLLRSEDPTVFFRCLFLDTDGTNSIVRRDHRRGK